MPLPDTTIHRIVDRQPAFPGGEGELFDFIKKGMVYPKAALDADVQGTVYVEFVVEKDGTVTRYKILRTPGKELNDEAFRLLKRMPAWIPGMVKGQPCRTAIQLPIRFYIGPDTRREALKAAQKAARKAAKQEAQPKAAE